MNSECVIVGNESDVHVPPIVAAVAAHGGTTLLVDVESLARDEYSVSERGLVFGGGRERIEITPEERRGFIRRVAPPDWRSALTNDGLEGAIRAAWLAVVVGLARGFPIQWLTDIDQLVFSENKIVQYLMCQRYEIPTPETVVPSSASAIPRSFGREVVVKPLGPSWFRESDGTGKVVFTTLLERDAPELAALSGAPFIVQKKIEATAHLRVVTVNDRCWVCELDGEGLPLDWRTSDEAHSAFRAALGFSEVRSMALRLAELFRLGYSSQDWLVSPTGEALFIDLNPAGQWLFLPPEVADAVTDHIGRWLVRGREDS